MRRRRRDAGAGDAGHSAIALPESGPLKDRIERMEATILTETLVRCRWNKSRAAEELPSRVGLRAKLDRYGIARGGAARPALRGGDGP